MPDHVHILLTPAIDQSTGKSIQLIKGGYSFAARKQSPGEIWHSGHHEHRVRDLIDYDLIDYDQQLLYIANIQSANTAKTTHTSTPTRTSPNEWTQPRHIYSHKLSQLKRSILQSLSPLPLPLR
jgi:hypothetical protein